MSIKKYFLQTFWCSMNQADSEKINMIILQSWFIKVNNWQDANLIIFNTCSVRQKWEDKVFWMLREIKKFKKKQEKLNNKIKMFVWITWCMIRKTGIDWKYLNDYKRDSDNSKNITFLNNSSSIFNNDDRIFPRTKWNLDFAFRIEETKYLPHILTFLFKENIWKDYNFDDYLKTKQLRENPAQATIIIQTGCDNYCTFCIVPYTRWKENSRTIEDIIIEAKETVKSWAKEINLVWQNVNSYWKQWIDKKYWNKEKNKWNEGLWKSPFRQLLEELNKIKWLDRIRFTSSNPHDMTQDILDAHFELDKMCNYLHFALQSWSNEMLKKMNRRHNYNDFKKIVDYLRKKDPFFSISTDIIVWFSWETEKMFQETVKAFNECQFDFSYNARYSVRKWTIAEKIFEDNVPDNIKSERWHILNNILLENIIKRNSQMIWNIEKILISWEKDWYMYWRTRNFKEVFLKNNWKIKIWDLVNVKIIELDKYVLKGKIV